MIAPILTITEIATESMIPEIQKKNTTENVIEPALHSKA
jgi:hypothetical protein